VKSSRRRPATSSNAADGGSGRTSGRSRRSRKRTPPDVAVAEVVVTPSAPQPVVDVPDAWAWQDEVAAMGKTTQPQPSSTTCSRSVDERVIPSLLDTNFAMPAAVTVETTPHRP